LEVEVSEWFAEVSVQDGGTDGVDLASLEDIPVVPGLLPSGAEASLLTRELIEPSSSISTALLVMSTEDLFSEEFTLSLGNQESTGWKWVVGIESGLTVFIWTSGSLESVVLDQVLGEFVYWGCGRLGGITGEDGWDLSLIWVNPVSELILSSRELLHMWSPSAPSLSLLENLVGLNHIGLFLFLIRRVVLFQEFHLDEKLVLVVLFHNVEAGSDIDEAE